MPPWPTHSMSGMCARRWCWCDHAGRRSAPWRPIWLSTRSTGWRARPADPRLFGKLLHSCVQVRLSQLALRHPAQRDQPTADSQIGRRHRDQDARPRQAAECDAEELPGCFVRCHLLRIIALNFEQSPSACRVQLLYVDAKVNQVTSDLRGKDSCAEAIEQTHQDAPDIWFALAGFRSGLSPNRIRSSSSSARSASGISFSTRSCNSIQTSVAL